MELIQAHDFYIGNWLIEPRRNQVTGDGPPVRISPKFMQVLVCLAEARGAVVTRDELLDRVWPDTVVGEAVLTRAISELRKVFADVPQAPQFIETIPKTGYRLVASVTETTALPHGDSQWQGDSVGVAEVVFSPGTVAQAQQPTTTRWVWPISVGVLVAIGALALTSGVFSRTPANPPPTRVSMQARPLTSYIGKEFDPALSPDGHRLAFSWYQPEAENTDLYVRDVEGNGLTQLTDHPAFDGFATWSPDGRFIAFIRSEDGKKRNSIYTLPSTGGPEQKLVDLTMTAWSDAMGLSWSPDGKWLVYSDLPRPGEASQIYLLSMETQERTPLTYPTGYQSDGSPRFSPDGRFVAFTRTSGSDGEPTGGLDIFVVPTEGGEPRQITSGGFEIEGLDWAASGERILFASRGNLWKVGIQGESPEWMSAMGIEIRQPTIAREGGRMVYAQYSFEVNIWRMGLTEANPKVDDADRIIASTRIDSDPRISPDGSRIAFISDRDGTCGIWTSNQDGTQPTQLTPLDKGCWEVMLLRWSPDSRHIAYVSFQQGQGDIYVVNTASGLQRRLTMAVSNETAPSWSNDGEWVYFSSNRGGSYEVWKTPTNGGDAVQVTHNGGFLAFESPDGQWLYYSRQGEAGIWRKPMDAGEEEQVLSTLKPDDAGNWRPVEGGIYFLHRQAEPNLAFFDATTRETRNLATLPPERFTCSQTDVAPNGEWALFAQIDRGASDLILVESL